MAARTIADFKKATWSNHRPADVVKALAASVAAGQAQYALHWAFELLMSGLVDTLWRCLWDCQVAFIFKPAVGIYLHGRWTEFQAQRTAHLSDMPLIRHNTIAQRIVAEAVTVLTVERHQKATPFPGKSPAPISAWAQAPARNYADAVLKPLDPPELRVAANEISWAIREGNPGHALFWLQWAHKAAKRVGAQPAMLAAVRETPGVIAKHWNDPVWLLWAVVADRTPDRRRPFFNALFDAYCFQWELGSRSGRMDYFVPAITNVVAPNDQPVQIDRSFLNSVDRDIPKVVAEFTTSVTNSRPEK